MSPAEGAAQERVLVLPWYGRGFYPTTVPVRILADGTPVTVEFEPATALGIDAFVRLTGGLFAGVTLLRAAPILTGFIGDREQRLGDDLLTTLAGLLSYRARAGTGVVFGFAGLGVTDRGEERRDRDLTGVFGAGFLYPLAKTFGFQLTVRDQVSSYDRFAVTPNALPPITVHELYLSVGPVFRL